MSDNHASSGADKRDVERNAGWGAYGGNPLALLDSGGSRLGPSLADFNPGLFKPVDHRKLANAAPLGLSGFALTTFLLALVNLNVRGAAVPNIVAAPAYAYGGLVQILAGMWEMASGNTFGAWALTSYGGFWVSLGIIFTPGGFGIAEAYGGNTPEFYTILGLYLIGWFIFTTLVLVAVLRSNLVFFVLILTVQLAFLLLGIAYMDNSGTTPAEPNAVLSHAGGAFAMIAAFLAWWAMLAGVQNKENSFFILPTFPFPWSPEARHRKK